MQQVLSGTSRSFDFGVVSLAAFGGFPLEASGWPKQSPVQGAVARWCARASFRLQKLVRRRRVSKSSSGLRPGGVDGSLAQGEGLIVGEWALDAKVLSESSLGIAVEAPEEGVLASGRRSWVTVVCTFHEV